MSNDPPTLSKPSIAASGIDHDALPPGTRFGEFEIIRVLGVGGFGIVYLAKDHSLEREVALKEYMPASLAARGAGPQITVRSSSFAETYAIGLRSFVNEARLLARFDHPSLVKVYRFWEDNATAYMVMPFLQGTTLRDTRRGMAHPPDEAWIRSVITPILSALELLHREGVYHRDIAPDNILLPHGAPPVLLDFGAARRVISDRTQSLTAILKPSYAPIEQYAEMTQLRQGPWTDLYALGAVIHYLLFGVPPSPATARAVQDDSDAIETRIVPGVSPRLLEVMWWMLAIRPNHRPQNGEQLRAVLNGQAEIPPRGPVGTTIPNAMANAAAAAAAARPASDGFAPTRVATAIVPTYMPTARVAPPAAAQPTTFSPAADMPTPRSAPTRADGAPPSRPAPLAPTASRPAPLAPAASRPAPLAPAAARPDERLAAIAPAPSRPVPLVAQPSPGPARAGSRSGLWLALAGGGAVIAIAAFAAWQSASRPGAASTEQAGLAASAAASSVAVVPVPTPALPAPTPVPVAAPVAVAEPASSAAPVAPATTLAQDAKPAAIRSLPASGADAIARTLTFDRSASASSTGLANADSSASAARARPPGRPVPKVGDDATTASTGTAPARPDNVPFAAPGSSSDRTRGSVTAAVRDPVIVPHPTAAAVPFAPPEPATAREACGKRVFVALYACMDERCEEPRYRTSAECVAVLARKAAREAR